MLVSLFYAVNPAAIYGVAYLVQRTILMVVMFGLLQMNLYLWALRTRYKILSVMAFVVSLLCFVLAMAFKEQAMPLILIYPLFSIGVWKWRSLIYNVLLLILCHNYLPSVLFTVKQAIYDKIGWTEHYAEYIKEACYIEETYIYLRSIITQTMLFFKYFLIWILPIETSIDMRDVVAAIKNPLPWVGFTAFIATFITGVVLLFKRTHRLLGLGIILAIALFVPELSRIRLGETFVVYRSYLYAIGYMIIIAYFLSKMPKRTLLICFLILLPLSLITYKRLNLFNNPAALWMKASDLAGPNCCSSFRADSNAGMLLMNKGVYSAAKIYLDKSLKSYTNYPASNCNLASWYYQTADWKNAEVKIKENLNNARFNVCKEAMQIIQAEINRHKKPRGKNEKSNNHNHVADVPASVQRNR